MDLTTLTFRKSVEVSQGVVSIRVIVLETFCAAKDNDDLLSRIIPKNPAMDVRCGVCNICNLWKTAGREAEVAEIG